MKKIIVFLIVLLLIVSFYFFSTNSEYKKNLTTTDEVGLATDLYLLKMHSYPAWYSDYLFNKYEKNNLTLVADQSPKPYLHIMSFIFAIERKEDLDSTYIQRTYDIEALLICHGLDHKRLEVYKNKIKGMPTNVYFQKKYNNFNDDSAIKYCIQKAINRL
ncbi:hypothetical protein [Acinetobacter sp. WCHAc060025]|uniref:hypothetical protein n=1 Tax=Acinetobacter sp. WCHAc060025 TaxID=2518625 RepID=UPI0010234811|nr:hypothetical protein [Acinetobacter sp. WCHAc060025]RZG72914.1 hypothetical protein EXE09_16160 [Acinetobacter sp. WCHAc060025]